MASIAGSVLDSGGNPLVRTIRVYRRDTGAFLAETTSSGSTGAWSVTDAYTGEVQVVMLDDSGGEFENDKIHRTTPV